MPKVKLFTHINQNASFVWEHTFKYSVLLGHCRAPRSIEQPMEVTLTKSIMPPPPAHDSVLYLYLSYHSVNIPTTPFYYNQLIKVCSDLTSTLLA